MTTRRTFLQQASLLSAGLLIFPSFSCTKPASNVGLQLYSLREQLPLDVKGVIAKVAEAGYKEVETYGLSIPDNKFWGMGTKDVKALFDSHGLSSPSGHYGIDQMLNTGETNDLQKIIEAASILKQEYVTVPYLADIFRKTTDDYKKVAAKFNTAAELCKKSDLKFAYHNHDFEFMDMGGVTGYDILLKETDPELVKFEADLYWIVRAGKDPIAMFDQHPGRFVMWHVKDMDKADNGLNTEIGSGTIDYKKIFEHTKTSGVEHFFVEQENFAIDPYESISKSFNHVKNVLLK